MENVKSKQYLGLFGAWALSFGCSVGWGAFVMPGTTFLPIAGPVGTAVGLGLGGLIMFVLAVNFQYLMERFPDCGGIYTYTKKAFDYDHGFLSAWFLILTYIAIIWANATALPLIARAVLGNMFQFGYLYQIAGYEIYIGEILLSGIALLTATMVCFFRKVSAWMQIGLASLLCIGVIICFAGAVVSENCTGNLMPAFAPEKPSGSEIFTIFSLAPWAFVGFESVTHSAEEVKFSLKKSFRMMVISLSSATMMYIFLALLAVKALPEGCGTWTEYIKNLNQYTGKEALPTFFTSYQALGTAGSILLGVSALGAIFTGLIGNYIALSRLLCSLGEDGLFPAWFGKRTSDFVPKNAILSIFFISLILPFFGRTAISWIVDVTTVGATIAYALASASTWKLAKQEKDLKNIIFGLAGLIISVLFALEFLIPNILAISTLSMESYLILTIWSILGFLYFRMFLHKDKERKMGHSIIAWIVLLGLIVFTSTVWMHQNIDKELASSAGELETYCEFDDEQQKNYIEEKLHRVNIMIDVASFVQTALICFSLIILLEIYTILQKREKQMEVEKVLAEESSRAKTSFLSNMSHEIRTPMNAIIGLDNIALRDENLPPKTREHLEKIGTSANHLLGLINDILDMSRIESGRMVLKDEEFSFQEFLNQVNIIINGQCQDKGLHYECNVAGEVHDFYYGDSMKLKQIMINILGNAVKFTNPSGSVSFSVKQLEELDNLCTLQFLMKDTGIGMEQDYIPKIFESFSQEDATATNQYGGSGLGMAITKNFIEMMQGNIQVESKKGVGSCFTVTLKLKASQRKSEVPEVSEDALETVLAGCRILMAEDVEQNAEILADLLELEDILSERAKNGKEAVQMFSDSKEGYYDAILMDVRMPEMDGFTATKMIRSLERPDAKKIPIIAMTANVFEEDMEQSRQAGMNAHLAKPIEPEKMYQTIAHFIVESKK